MGGHRELPNGDHDAAVRPSDESPVMRLSQSGLQAPRHWKADTNRANLLRENVVIGRIPRAIVQWLCNEFCRGRARQNREGLCFQLERLGVGDGD